MKQEPFNQNLGILVPTLLLPNFPLKNQDKWEKWAVIACDQYTSFPAYWEKVKEFVKEEPSTYNLILPEAYLNDADADKHLQKIHQMMRHYLDEKILAEQSPALMYIERKISPDRLHQGLILAVDLEQFDFSPKSKSLIRPTEETILDRIPPRIKIREEAMIELPHIFLLIDDSDKTVIEPLQNQKSNFEKIYEFPLMFSQQKITGYKISNQDQINKIMTAFSQLLHDSNNFLFAVGDGNHSLATAKTHWENIKKEYSSQNVIPARGALPAEAGTGIQNHPARFALVEVVNLYEESLIFEPIHRILFNIEEGIPSFLNQMLATFQKHQINATYHIDTPPTISTQTQTQILPFLFENQMGYFEIKNPEHLLPVGSLQTCLDECLKNHKIQQDYVKDNEELTTILSQVNGNLYTLEIDYIHGDEVLKELTQKANTLGFILPAIPKHDLFSSIIQNGVMPRKTFSIGNAEEKRFYIECRKIIR